MQLTLSIKYFYHIVKGCIKITHYHICGSCVESIDTDFTRVFNYLILCELSIDKEEMQLHYHPQLNELIDQVCNAIVFDAVTQKKLFHSLCLSNPMKERFYIAAILSFRT